MPVYYDRSQDRIGDIRRYSDCAVPTGSDRIPAAFLLCLSVKSLKVEDTKKELVLQIRL